MRPTIGLLALSAEPSDPEIGARHEGYLAQVTRRVVSISDVLSGPSAGSAAQVADAAAELTRLGADGLMLAPLGESGVPGCAQALAGTDLPLLLAGIQPERTIGADWTPYDLRFNRSIAATQELAAQLTSAGVRFAAIAGDWLSDSFLHSFEDWARAARVRRSVASVPPGDLLELAAESLVDVACMCRFQAVDRGRGAILMGPCPRLSAVRGRVTTVALARLDAQRVGLVVGSGEIVGAAELPRIDGQYLLFSPDRALDAFLEAWLAVGATADILLAAGDSRNRWRHLARLLESDHQEI